MRLSAALLALFLVAGCGTFTDHDASVFLRVENASAVDFASVSVDFDREEATYGAVRAGGASEYKVFETAHRYGLVVVRTADGETYGPVIYDFFYPEPLAPGRYTYRLGVGEDGLRLEFEQD